LDLISSYPYALLGVSIQISSEKVVKASIDYGEEVGKHAIIQQVHEKLRKMSKIIHCNNLKQL